MNSKVNSFFGKFHLGGLYDLKNFGNMLVSNSYIKKDNFTCKFEIEKKDKKVIQEEDNLTLILSDDAFVLFENVDENYGKITFWSTLYY